MTKSFYLEDGMTYTQDAMDCEGELVNHLSSIFKQWIKKGFSVRDIAHLANQAVMETECDLVLLIRARDVENKKLAEEAEKNERS
jgi:hypothetical protein